MPTQRMRMYGTPRQHSRTYFECIQHLIRTLQAPWGYQEEGGGGAEGSRTPDLRIANATLSQLSYGPAAAAGAPRPGRRRADHAAACAALSSEGGPGHGARPPRTMYYASTYIALMAGNGEVVFSAG